MAKKEKQTKHLVSLLVFMMLMSIPMIVRASGFEAAEAPLIELATGALRTIRNVGVFVGGAAAACCFVGKMASKNQRTVEECNTWLKRCVVAVACLVATEFIINLAINVGSSVGGGEGINMP